MPISATANRPRRDAGFTLVEVMTTLMIVGLVASAVVLMAPGAGSRVREAAERLAARLDAASDASVMLNRGVALTVTADGYGFERQDESGWRRIETEPALAFQAWPAGTTARIEKPAPADRAGERITEFDPLGGATAMRIVIEGGGSRWTVAVDDMGAIHVDRSH
jgi:general secretion pathway protein H